MAPENALKNCQSLKVVLTEPHSKGRSNRCLALVPQWESYHVYKYMRVPPNSRSKASVNDDYPLQAVSRSHSDSNKAQMLPDYKMETEPSFKVLVDYIQAMPKAHEDMTALLGDTDRKQPLIVQVCNKGQSELLSNFVCAARARGLDISRVFLFATDEYTLDLCRKLGIQFCYYDSQIFADMPEKAADHYADLTFGKMMMAKVYCVHLALTLGYDVLFQDVDMIWYQNPLSYFARKEWRKWDLLFQDDGARTPRYAPYSPNTGFYYVRRNEKTLFLFNRLLKMGDTIMRYKSHQAALTAAINESVSWIRLRVKVWRWGEDNPFLGGVEYHRRKDLMKIFLNNQTKVEPYIFHMSWTTNKDNKKKFMQQLGEWRVKDNCSFLSDGVEGCCLAKPNIVCHYRDKPSVVPCRDSPSIDKGKPSFW